MLIKNGNVCEIIDNKVIGVVVDKSKITKVVIPEGVTSIGSKAFSGCSNLQNVTIPEGVTSIADGAFEECSNLQSVDIPASVKNIGFYAFRGCNLKEVYLPDTCSYYFYDLSDKYNTFDNDCEIIKVAPHMKML